VIVSRQVSRAMRNRGIEVALLHNQLDKTDLALLAQAS
jgi:hypothetical protein